MLRGRAVPPEGAGRFPRRGPDGSPGPGTPVPREKLQNKWPWRSPVIFGEQQVAKKLPLAVSKHSRVEKVRPRFSQNVPQNLPWRSPVIFREQQVDTNCTWQSQVTPKWKKCALKLRLVALIAKHELQKLSLAV